MRPVCCLAAWVLLLRTALRCGLAVTVATHTLLGLIMSEADSESSAVIAADEYGPIVFHDLSKHGYVVAKGGDGTLYVVVNAPGGWQQRAPYHGSLTTLCRIGRSVAVPLAQRMQAETGSPARPLRCE